MLDVKKSLTKILVALRQKADVSNLATVATSGDYDDLSNKPSFEWTLIKTVTGTPSSTIDLSDYKEVLVTCRILGGTVPRFASVVIPKNMIGATYKEWSVGFSSSASSAVFGALFRLSLTNFTPQWAYANGTNLSSSSEWNLYAR